MLGRDVEYSALFQGSGSVDDGFFMSLPSCALTSRDAKNILPPVCSPMLRGSLWYCRALSEGVLSGIALLLSFFKVHRPL